MSAFELRHVSVVRGHGRHRTEAMRDVSLVVESGEIVLLEGPSGAGKTTLLCVAAGLLSPERGEVLVADQRMTGLAPAALRALRAKRIGFIFQRANLLDGLSVRENVAIAAMLAGTSRREASQRAEALLDVLGIARLGDRSIDTLSGGEEHRVAIARALVHDPALVLADEPTGNLDSVSGRAVAEALARLANERGVAVVIATHDARLRPFADRRLRIVDGRVDTPPATAAHVPTPEDRWERSVSSTP